MERIRSCDALRGVSGKGWDRSAPRAGAREGGRLSRIFYNVDQAARKLGLSVRQVEAMISSEELPAIVVGTRRVIPANAVDRLSVEKAGATAQGDTATKEKRTNANDVAPRDTDRRHYTDVEVAQRLGKPYTEIFRMANLGQLPVKFVDDKRMFPKDAIDHLAAQRSKAGEAKLHPRVSMQNSSKPAAAAEEYFSPDQLAYALQRPVEDVERMIRWGEVKSATIEGQRWIPREQVEKVIARRQESRQGRIRKRLSMPRLFHAGQSALGEDAGGSAPKGSARERSVPEDSKDDAQTVTNVSERAVMKAAQSIGTSINQVRQMVADGKLMVHPGNGLLVTPEELGKLLSGRGGGTSDVAGAPGSDRPPTASGDAGSAPATLEEKVERLENEKQALADELDHEKTWHARNLGDAQHEIDHLDIQLENVRNAKDRVIEDLGADVEELELKVRDLEAELTQERERREEAEQAARSLQRDQDEERELLWGAEHGDDEGSEQRPAGPQNSVRGFLETFGKNVRDALGTEEGTDRSGQWELAQLREELDREREAHENDRSKAQYDYARLENAYRDLDEQNRTLKEEIDGIKSGLSEAPTREELEVKLKWNEAQRRDLEKNLALEKQRARQLESGVRTLAEIRRLLAGDGPPAPESAEAASTPGGAGPEADVSALEVLRVRTRNGEWVFRPPFVLEPEEVELLRLVAGEDGITAEQIKRRTGRRRAVDDLDDLLDRLHTEGLEPIKESNDRYSFDPDLLQD